MRPTEKDEGKRKFGGKRAEKAMGKKKLLGKWEGPHVIMVVGRNNRGRKGKPVVMTERMDVSRLMDSKVADVTED